MASAAHGLKQSPASKKPYSFRERQVLLCLCVHLKNEQIAELLGVTTGMIGAVIERIKKKRAAQEFNRMELALNLNAAVKDAFLHPRLGPRIPLGTIPIDDDPTPEGSD